MPCRVNVLNSHLQTNPFVRVERRGEWGFLYMLHCAPRPSLGASLTSDMRRALLRGLRLLQADSGCRVILLLSDSTQVFSIGINTFNFADGLVSNLEEQTPSLLQLTAAIEESPTEVVAFIQGECSSWGVELVMAAAYRIAAPNCCLSFPEVQLSLVPCGGGTQRLVRLVGVRKALSILCTGRRVLATEAQSCGLVDAIVEEQKFDGMRVRGLLKRVMSLSEKLVQQSSGMGLFNLQRRQKSRVGLYLLNQMHLAWMEHKIQESTPRGLRAPYMLLQAVHLAVRNADDFSGGVAAEEKLFRNCLAEKSCIAMQHALRAADRTLAEWELHRATTIFRSVCAAASRPLQRAVVLGAEAVGSSLAFLLVQHGFFVTLVEPNLSRKNYVLEHIKSEIFATMQTKLYPTATEAQLLLSRLSVVCSQYHDASKILESADVVFECISESLEIKRHVFSYLDRVCGSSCVFVSSAPVDITRFAFATRNPQRVVGMHFYPPANESPVVELARLPCTDANVLHCVLTLIEQLNKHVVLTYSQAGGYAGTRLLLAALYQANAMLEDGCFPHEVDNVLKKKFNFQCGIFEFEDVIGLDVMAMARDNLPPGVLPERKVFGVADELVGLELVGRKRGEGWYRYKGKITPSSQVSNTHLSLDEAASANENGSNSEKSIGALVVPVNIGNIAVASRGRWLGSRANETSLPFKPKSMTSTSIWNPIEWHLSNLFPGGQWQTLLATHSMSVVHNRGVEKRILMTNKQKGRRRRYISEEEIIERILLAMINEAAKLLGEGVAESAGDVDCLSIYAFGFPGWKGGLLYYADEVLGVEKIIKRTDIICRALGREVFLESCAVLREMQRRNSSFSRQFSRPRVF